MSQLQKAPWSEWETIRLIGRGSFGSVYEIQRKLVDEDTESAALKVISIPQNPGDVEELYSEGYDEESITATFNTHLKSIVSEYMIMQKMDGSANIVNCKDIRYIQHDDGIGWDIYIRMELLTPLVKALPMDVAEDTVVRLGKDICNALVLCKKYEIVHRDIKPQNIFISPNGDYKLGDFGIAKTVEKTMGGTKIGTYKYMAPEVYNNQPYGSAADIYSLGLVLYWLLNERRMPFMPLPPAKLMAGQDEDARYRRLSGEALPAPAHGSEALKKIVLKACAYNPADRYDSAEAMLADLNRLQTGDQVIAGGEPAELEEEKTMGPIFAVVQDTPDTTPEAPLETDTQIVEDDEATVGPMFLGKVVPQEEAPTQEEAPSKKEKKPILKYILIGAAAVVAILLLLLLRTCGKQESKDALLVVEPTEQETVPTEVTIESAEWSDWADKLPDGVTADQYTIEEKTLYSSRNLETTSSTKSNKMDGWELYDTVEANGEFGNWSDWSATKADSSDTREVQTQTRYRYRDKETTTSASSSKSGWTLYNTDYSWGNYGNWSSWSTSSATKSDSREVETKKQYRYRTRSYTNSTNSSLSGWTWYNSTTSYSSWGSWSGWSNSYIAGSDTREVETRYIEPTYRTEYNYSRYTQYDPATGRVGWTGPTKGYWSNIYCQYYQERGWSTTQLSYCWSDSGYGVYGYNNYYWYNEQSRQVVDTAGYTQYRYRDRTKTTTHYYYKWSSWSDYSDTYVTPNSDREVSERTLYRYRDRQSVPTYHFWRWKDWSGWSENQPSGNDNRQVENTTYYRYRDKVTEKTYYFKRWTDWSDYSETPVEKNETTEVQTKVQYRYKRK